MSWKMDKIREDMAARIPEDAKAQKQLLLDLLTQTYPLYAVLSNLDEDGPRGGHCYSKLFPETFDDKDDVVQVYESDKGNFIAHPTVGSEWMTLDYETRDSILLSKHTPLPDMFVVLGGSSDRIGGSSFWGNITMADIRALVSVFPKRKEIPHGSG